MYSIVDVIMLYLRDSPMEHTCQNQDIRCNAAHVMVAAVGGCVGCCLKQKKETTFTGGFFLKAQENDKYRLKFSCQLQR